MNAIKIFSILTISAFMPAQQANAAIALDRTRIIFDGDNKSISVSISNQNNELPYLAQGWIEDERGKKIESPLVVLPPLQRVEPGAKSLVKIQGMPAVNALPQDRETLFYFNLREIPPKVGKINTLQIALQTRVKLFYRPKPIQANQQDYADPWQKKLTLTREGDKYRIHNPTPYYVTLSAVMPSVNGKRIDDFNPIMVAPKGSDILNVKAALLGSSPVISYINDFGGRPQLIFNCNGTHCSVKENKPG
ncbi:molecular chaperone [Pectobacterium betavasculorum]|uniref:Molecular chaperone n=1 Tax=Pectobacterium betavasculorum TaxID=55207 RepID=A0A093SGK1_9GAMM|nr:fimbria/pilus periplasmic chaperone [Pectobacterium betavasculorum]KFX00499.1 molecular chaperone [Pectobacterium betavasculorum]KFX14320.1 molecular chaperone [Pectobacterium betavasculorum]